MVRIFDEPEIVHIEGNVDPIRDIEIIHDELRLKDLEIAKKTGDDLEKKVVRGNDKTLKTDYVSYISSNSSFMKISIGNNE
jgi:obg-like ATPase 1